MSDGDFGGLEEAAAWTVDIKAKADLNQRAIPMNVLNLSKSPGTIGPVTVIPNERGIEEENVGSQSRCLANQQQDRCQEHSEPVEATANSL